MGEKVMRLTLAGITQLFKACFLLFFTDCHYQLLLELLSSPRLDVEISLSSILKKKNS
jgi:hypothetical protein